MEAGDPQICDTAATTSDSDHSNKENVPPPSKPSTSTSTSTSTNKAKSTAHIPQIVPTSFKKKKRSKRKPKRVPLADITTLFNISATSSTLPPQQQSQVSPLPRRTPRSSKTLRMGFR